MTSQSSEPSDPGLRESGQHARSKFRSVIPISEQKRHKLTVLIPCKNERRNIRACVERVRSIADEILVADSGSEDGTLEIVKQLGGCRIIEREYENSADFKNWAIPQATHEWVFIVDADERVPDGLIREIDELLGDPPDHLDAYSCGFQDFFMGHPLKHARWDTKSIRLIRRDACRYQHRRVHANIDIDPRRVGSLKTKILHYSTWNYEDFIQKYNRYTSWGAEELRDRGKHATFKSLLIRPFLRFLHMYFIRRGFLDGLPGLQVCVLMSFFNTFLKQAKLWQMEFALAWPDTDQEIDTRQTLEYSTRESATPRAVPGTHPVAAEGFRDAA
ncbi:MAG: glycosyltransferase family 2 protein [Pirellulaceae bacterium]